MLWLDIFIMVGLVSVFIPAVFSFIISLKSDNILFKSLLVTVISLVFSAAPIFYIYSGSHLYIMSGVMVGLSLLGGICSFLFFKNQVMNKTNTNDIIKAG